jgi:TPR repeat protein
VRWLLKAAFAGQVDAQYLLGEEIYRDDNNRLASTAWLLKAALQGHEEARERLNLK